MLIDGRNPPQRVRRYDLCLVGSGAAGQTIYREFLDSSLRIALVESGGLQPDPETQKLRAARSDGIQIDRESRQRFLGGTMNSWQHACVAMDPIDFRPRAWVPLSGWPLTRRSLDPYYHRAAQILEIPSPPQLQKVVGELPAEPRLRAEPMRATMVVYAPPKQGFDAELATRLRNSEHHDLFLHSNLTRIDWGDEGRRRVNSIRVQALQGPPFDIQARILVLACGGIENARLLLATGAGNANDLVGRCFMEHPKGEYGYLKLRQPLETRPFAEFEHGGLRCACGLTAGEPTQARLRMLNCSLRLYPRPAEPSAPFGKLALKNFQEMQPDPSNRVTLGSEKDRLGLPRAQIRCRLSELDRGSMIRLHRLLGEHFQALGLAELEGELESQLEHWPLTRDASHHMGTTRMGDSPANSVVDANCRLHQVDNLYVAGSSVFATSGHSNPTYTIVALSLRLADHLKGVMG